MELERKIDAIVDILADVAVRQQKAEERAEATDRRIEKLEKQVQMYVSVGLRLLLKQENGQKELRKEMRELAVAHKDLAAAHKDLAAAQKKTEILFQRWLTGQSGTNGHGKRPR